MRKLTSHVVNPANDRLTIEVLDGPGQGNACHRYEISGFTVVGNPGVVPDDDDKCVVLFQNGPIGEGGVGVNGVTHEALLAILIDRLEGFQAGQYRCRENALALTHLQDAVHWLAHRTRERMARGVEGTHAA
jgi:hypothetical protein